MSSFKRNYEMFKDELREAFLEHYDGIDMENEDGEQVRNPDYEPGQYWQDGISELADQAIPVYTDDMYELWMGLGRPEVDDSGMIEGVTDIDKIVAAAIYSTATAILYEFAQEFELDD